MRQQGDVSQKPGVRRDLCVSVGQLDSVLPPNDRQVRPLSRGDYQPDDSEEADVRSRPGRGRSDKLKSPSRGEQSRQGGWNATVTKEQKALDAQSETQTTAEVIDNTVPRGVKKKRPATRRDVTGTGDYTAGAGARVTEVEVTEVDGGSGPPTACGCTQCGSRMSVEQQSTSVEDVSTAAVARAMTMVPEKTAVGPSDGVP